jgi:2-polyprenyl-3-methyl-5-hydroxy-6-metoxy-1,4-benzoquinol methylase
MKSSEIVTRDCPLCGSTKRTMEVSSKRRAESMSIQDLHPYWETFASEKVFFSYARCSVCDLLFAPSFFSNDQLSDLYADMPANMRVVTSDAIDATQRSYFDAIAETAPLSGDYLEIGPDVGHVAQHAAREGDFDKFWLFEPNKAVHQQLAGSTGGRPHHISTDMTDLSAVPEGTVGVAVMVHVLDHLLDPADLVEQIRAKLRPDGVLAIVTHNEASVLRRIMGNRWPPFCLQHPELYSPESITRLLRASGYTRVEVRRAKSYFPMSFMAQQAAGAVGLKLDRVPLPNAVLGLRLGNILTLARN